MSGSKVCRFEEYFALKIISMPILHVKFRAACFDSASSWVKKVAGAGRCNFSTNSSKFPTEQIVGAQQFNFAPKFSNKKSELMLMRRATASV